MSRISTVADLICTEADGPYFFSCRAGFYHHRAYPYSCRAITHVSHYRGVNLYSYRAVSPLFYYHGAYLYSRRAITYGFYHCGPLFVLMPSSTLTVTDVICTPAEPILHHNIAIYTHTEPASTPAQHIHTSINPQAHVLDPTHETRLHIIAQSPHPPLKSAGVYL